MSTSCRNLYLASLLLVLLAHVSGGNCCTEFCVARSDATDEVIQKALDWVCVYGSACGRIQPGQTCYRQGDLRGVASVAFNDYWQQVKYSPGGHCDLFGAAVLVANPPSFDNCPSSCL